MRARTKDNHDAGDERCERRGERDAGRRDAEKEPGIRSESVVRPMCRIVCLMPMRRIFESVYVSRMERPRLRRHALCLSSVLAPHDKKRGKEENPPSSDTPDNYSAPSQASDPRTRGGTRAGTTAAAPPPPRSPCRTRPGRSGTANERQVNRCHLNAN